METTGQNSLSLKLCFTKKKRRDATNCGGSVGLIRFFCFCSPGGDVGPGLLHKIKLSLDGICGRSTCNDVLRIFLSSTNNKTKVNKIFYIFFCFVFL